MATVTKNTGSSGIMRIVDDGVTVTFQLLAGSGSFNHDLPWGYTVNGATNNSRQTDYTGNGAYKTLDSWTVSSSQTVTFRLFDTGTSGMGGPTTLSMVIDRATVPPAPTKPTMSAITATGFTADTNSNGTGGATVDLIQIGIGNSTASSPTVIQTASSSGAAIFTGRVPGTLYRVWARYHNSEGYSAWSAMGTVTTLNHPAAPSTPVLSEVSQTSVRVKFTDGTNGGSAITGRTIGYGLSSAGPTTTIASDGDDVITGLSPGQTYYFWAWTTNIYGDSPNSPSASVKLQAGAKILVGAVYKDAVPYVRSGGVWKVAKPFVRQGGFWKEGL